MAKKKDQLWGMGCMYNHMVRIDGQWFLPAFKTEPLTKKEDGTYWYNDINYGTPKIYDETTQRGLSALFANKLALPHPQTLLGNVANLQPKDV